MRGRCLSNRFWSQVFAHQFFTVNETEKNDIIADLFSLLNV